MTDGAFALAFAKRDLTAFSDSPTHLLKSSGPFTARKFSLASEATARAMRVLLQPGGPNIKTPVGGRIPIRLNASWCL
uniref:Calmodulin-interacting protein 111 isoform X1 n=1 Tax=Rhizophora mucronata TaxID=61149 RepID=A0A2P2LBI8_RHIMU